MNAHNFLNIYWNILMLGSKWLYWFKESHWRIFAIPVNQFSQLLKMMKIYMFLILILYRTFQYENIIPTNMCYDQMDVFIQNVLEISARTLSEILKTLNAHNFLNSYQKILILDFKKIALIQRNPTKEEFLQFHLTSSHNYSKWWKITCFWFWFFTEPLLNLYWNIY